MTGNEEQVYFYLELGRALSQWALVESHLTQIAAACVGPEGSFKVMNAFITIANFRSKLDFAESMVYQATKGTDLYTKWNTLYADLVALAKTRNLLAHGAHGVLGDKPGRRFGIRWPDYETPIEFSKKTGAPIWPQGAMHIREIFFARTKFFGMSISLNKFHTELIGQPVPQHLASFQLPTDPPPLDVLTARYRKELAELLRPSAE